MSYNEDMNVQAMPEPTFPELLRPYRSAAIAEAVGVTGDTVRLWRAGQTSPATDKIPSLAEFLRLDVAAVVRAIAAQKAVA